MLDGREKGEEKEGGGRKEGSENNKTIAGASNMTRCWEEVGEKWREIQKSR